VKASESREMVEQSSASALQRKMTTALKGKVEKRLIGLHGLGRRGAAGRNILEYNLCIQGKRTREGLQPQGRLVGSKVIWVGKTGGTN